MMRLLLSTVLFVIILTSCQRGNSSRNESNTLFADTIVYEALIHNIDPSAPWQNDWLKGLKREEYVSRLFDLAYSKEIKVVDYDTQQPISMVELKEWDESNPRTTIGKLQFTEAWGFNDGEFTKKIIAIMPAYEVFTDEGELRAYKAKVKMIFN